MIVKILASSASFSGVSYNTDKIGRGKGDLMKVSNFGPLQALEHLRPEDYKNYLKLLSAQNKRVKAPQFHAVISAKGNTYDKTALTEIAVLWLKSMGYGEQPFLIVYHNDTDNNHVHMVSTRIDRTGKTISSSFENNRAIQNLNKILGLDEKQSAKRDIEKALSYGFSTKAQFMMVLESQGYALREKDTALEVIKFGVKQGAVELKVIEESVKNYHPDQERKTQITAIFHKYAKIYNTALKPNGTPLAGEFQKKSNGFTSDFSACLKEKFGIGILFHASADKPPYGYSVIDHAGKTVFKGGEIMPLKEMLEMPKGRQYFSEADSLETNGEFPGQSISEETLSYYAAIMRAALYNYPDLVQGLQHQGLTLIRNGGDFTLADPGARIFINALELLDEGEYRHLTAVFSESAEWPDETEIQNNSIRGINIASDIDDEAIHGRKRKKKASTINR
jgi:hypothetical protein